MNLPNPNQVEALDLSLRRTLQNWIVRKDPPVDGKARLMRAAAAQPLARNSFISVYFSLALEHDTELYLYRLKLTDISSLRLSAFGMC